MPIGAQKAPHHRICRCPASAALKMAGKHKGPTQCLEMRGDDYGVRPAAQKAGLAPTGILANMSRAAGFCSVSDLLTQVRADSCLCPLADAMTSTYRCLCRQQTRSTQMCGR